MGPATAALAARCARTTTPRRAVTTARLERAQLSERDAFVLSLIDDRLSLQSLLDVAGMPERELLTIVDRLVRLDLVVLS